MYKALYLSPMIPSFNIAGTVDFFRNVFEFNVVKDETNYVILEKDNLTLHILNAGENTGEMSFYFEVDKIDELWDSVKDKIQNIRVRKPFDREYGMREFHIDVPNTETLMFVGQKINPE